MTQRAATVIASGSTGSDDRKGTQMKRYTLEDHEDYRKEQDEKAAKEAEERRERTEKESARRVWVGDGGSESDFEREWPKLRDEGRRRRVVDADRRAREEMQASGVSRI
jgi:hypothetical protein